MMTRSVPAWRESVSEPPTRPDPLAAMLAASFGTCTATIPLDNALGIVEVLQERCTPEVLLDVYRALERVVTRLETRVQ